MPSPTPTPTTPSGAPAFGTRPASGALAYSGNCPSVIEGKTFRDLGPDVISIRIENCSNVTIRDVDFINVAEGVYAVNSSNITVERVRYQNILGPSERVGLNRANLVQFNNVQGGRIADSKGKCGDTEDIVSVYRSSNVIVERNHFEGALTSTAGCLAWRSSSGTCIIVGDAAGTGNVIRDNICVNPGQVGVAIAGGTNNRIENNIVYGQQRPLSNIAIYVANYSGYAGSCSGNSVTGNRIWWRNAAGQSNNTYLPSSCSGTVSSGNISNDTTLTYDALRVIL